MAKERDLRAERATYSISHHEKILFVGLGAVLVVTGVIFAR
jgi:hypothetical protein